MSQIGHNGQNSNTPCHSIGTDLAVGRETDNGVSDESRTKDHPDKRPPSWFFYGEILSHLTAYSFIREQVKK